MPRAIWSGAISFGLVNVPVKLYSATSPKSVRFHQLSRETGSRIRQKRVDPTTGDEVAFDDIVKGYELTPDRYVIIEPEELDALGDCVDHLDLLVKVLVEEKVELVKGRAGDLPVVLLVHVTQGDGVGEELVEFGDHVGADFGAERMRHILDHGAVLLDLSRVRVPVGRNVRVVVGFLDCNCHFAPLLTTQPSDAARWGAVSRFI